MEGSGAPRGWLVVSKRVIVIGCSPAEAPEIAEFITEQFGLLTEVEEEVEEE